MISVDFLNETGELLSNGLTLTVPAGFFSTAAWQNFDEVTSVALPSTSLARLTISLDSISTTQGVLVDEVILMNASAVDGVVRATGATGTTGATGATGESGGGGSGGIIVFTNQNTTGLTTNATGQSTNVFLVNFSNRSNPYALTGNTFSLPAGDNQYSFTMPYDANIVNIYANFVNAGTFTPSAGANVYPYVILATAPSNSNIFTFIPETETEAAIPFVGGTSHPANTVLAGSSTDINYTIPAGTRVAICCVQENTGTTYSSPYLFYYSGGIQLA